MLNLNQQTEKVNWSLTRKWSKCTARNSLPCLLYSTLEWKLKRQ